MTFGGWILLILCVLGVLLAAGSLVPVARSAMRLLRHLSAIAGGPVFKDVERFEEPANRIARVGGDVGPLLVRLQTAIASIRESARTSGFGRIVQTVRAIRGDLQFIAADLRRALH